MNSSKFSSRFAAALPGLALLASGSVALADDTEILTGQVSDYAAPNILFVIDTSGSMAGQVLVDDSYDAAASYSGPYTDPNRLYYVLADAGGNFNYPDDDYVNFGAYVDRTALVCNKAQNLLPSAGFFVDRFSQFDPEDAQWGFLVGADDDPLVSGARRFTECFSDDGIHGAGDNLAEVYPVNSDMSVPYTDDANSPDRFNWSNYPLRYAFFDNNYLNWISEQAANGTPVVQTRLEVVQGVTSSLIDRLTVGVVDPLQTFNVGLMRFSTDAQGGMVLQPITDVAASRDDLLTAVNGMSPSNNTPLSESLYEAYQYMRGGPVDFGRTSQPVPSISTSYTGDLAGGATYDSPVLAECQKNYIVLLTDGLPTTDTDANDRIANIIGSPCVGNCLDDLSQHMATADFSATLPDTQSIDTFTIGFFTDSQLLANTATGQVQPDEDLPPIPGYFLADNVSELSNAFDAIFTEIETDVTTFTSPAASVNAVNRLQNRDVLYFTVFEPSPMGEPHWDGNLKAYYLGRQGNLNPDDAPSELAILDADRLPALNDDNTFRSTARSIWSESDDGGNITEGGFISRMSANRTVYTNAVGNALTAVEVDNAAITAEMLGIPVMPGPQGANDAAARRAALIEFGRGVDENGDPLRMMGDPLHTQPLVVTYAGGADNLALFASTNDGYLHRLDPTPTEGNIEDLEEWAFIPRDLLPNLDVIERNPPSPPNSSNKLYGLDGPLTSFIVGDENSIVDANEELFIYTAMRRGGTSYYGLSLGQGGDRPPQLRFEISRGTEFPNLGQTWSAATPARISDNGTERDVLIFGGGYDPAHDSDGGYNPTTDMGNAIYAVDAKTGDLVWRAGSDDGADITLPEMVWPIPSDVAVLDVNQDGLADRMYVGDLGGQVWRIDILQDGSLHGGLFASLSESGAAGERRFYNAPSVALIPNREGNFLSVSIGSGWRAHPLSTSNTDRLYVLKDKNVFSPQVSGTPAEVVYADPLTNADLNPYSLTNPADASELIGPGGWYFELGSGGEKNLSKALTIDSKVFFTTYKPERGPLGCQPTATVGQGRLYVLDIRTGEPAQINADGTTTAFVDLESGGIPPAPQLVFAEPPCVANCGPRDPDNEDDPAVDPVYATVNGTCINANSEVSAVVGFNNIPTSICTAPVRTYWTEADDDLGEL